MERLICSNMCWLHCDANVQGPFWLSDSRTLFIFLDPHAQKEKRVCFLEATVIAIV